MPHPCGAPQQRAKGLAAAAGTLVLLAGGCRSPLDGEPEEVILQQTVSESIGRELANLPPAGERQSTSQPPGDVEATLAERREELDSLGPDSPSEGLRLHDLGPDLTGAERRDAALNLRDAILSAVRHNLGIQASRLRPAIAEADVVAAEAAFDALFFAGASLDKLDEPSTVPVLGGIPLGTPFSARTTYRFDTGIRKPLLGGGDVFLATDLLRGDNQTPGFDVSPDPAYTAAVRLGLSQPLLRGFGSEVNSTAIRLARNEERRSIHLLRGELLLLVAGTEAAYWDLVLAWHELSIRQWMVDVGIEVRDKLAKRREFDTTVAQYSDAVARVEQRKADVIRARRRVRGASDRLKGLINDPDITVGSELVYTPLDEMVDAPISYSLRDAIVIAVSERPQIEQAILAIDDASIRETLADNARLPLLNLNAEMAFTGLDGTPSDSYTALDDDFINYLVALTLEVPVGNRQAEAGFRRARLERSAAVIQYQRVVQEVVLDVKSAMRSVIANYELIQATRSFRVAQAENLRALLAEEETLASLTPVFLNLKFDQQDRLARARFDELQALASFDQALADLYRAMGTGLKMNGIDVQIVDEAGADGTDP